MFLLTKLFFVGFEGSICAIERIKVHNWRGNVWLEEVRCKFLDGEMGSCGISIEICLFVYEKAR